MTEETRYSEGKLYHSRHIFFWPFNYTAETAADLNPEEYAKRLQEKGLKCGQWQSFAKEPTLDEKKLYGLRQYLSNEGRKIWPEIEKEVSKQNGEGIKNCVILNLPLLKGAVNRYIISGRIKSEGENAAPVPVSYELILDKAELHIYRFGVGILLLHCLNDKYPELPDIQRIGDWGRRLELAYKPAQKNDPGIAADELKLTVNGTEMILTLFDPEKGMIGSADRDHFLKPFVWAEWMDVRVVPASDDRLFEMELIQNQELSNRMADNSVKNWREKEDLTSLLYGILFLDPPGDPTCQDGEMRRKILEGSLDPRWMDYGTFYGITEFSFLCITGTNWKYVGAPVVIPFMTQYSLMASLVLAQRTALFGYAERARELIQNITDNRRKNRLVRYFKRI